jgi:hypothetical protein
MWPALELSHRWWTAKRRFSQARGLPSDVGFDGGSIGPKSLGGEKISHSKAIGLGTNNQILDRKQEKEKERGKKKARGGMTIRYDWSIERRDVLVWSCRKCWKCSEKMSTKILHRAFSQIVIVHDRTT